MKRERVKTKRGFKDIGIFILGWFIGFICTILIIAGVGYWAYTSVSVKKVEKWTKTDIAGNNESIKSLTLQDVVAIAMGVAKGSDEYTLAKFEEDFGLKLIGDTLYGISLDKLKNAPIKQLKTALDDTIDSATFNNVLSFMEVDDSDLGLLNTLLNEKIEYYLNGGKLYTNKEYTIEAGFEYTIEGDVVKFSNGSHTIASNKITPRLRDLPLTTAITSMTDVTKDLQIYELLDYHYDENTDKYYQTYSNGEYSNPVSGVMDAIAEYTINELSDQSKIDSLKIYEVMGYYYNDVDKNYYTTATFDEGTKVAGVMNSLADKVIGDLSNEKTFNDLYIYQVMGYTQVEIAGNPITYKYTDKNGDVTGIMATLAGKTIGQLDDVGAFNNVVVADALGYYKHTNGKYYTTSTFEEGTEVTGVIAHLAGSKISTLSADIKMLSIGKILDIEKGDPNNSTIIEALYDSTIETLNEDIKSLKLGKILGVEKGAGGNSAVIDALYDSTISTLNEDINNLTLGSALGVEQATATGVVKVLYNTKITGLNSAMKELKIYQALGYYYNETGQKYYEIFDGTTYSKEVELTGIIKAIANTKVDELSTTINTLKAADVFDKNTTTVLKLFNDTELTLNYNNTGKPLTIMDLPNAVVAKINDSSTMVGTLLDAGVITTSTPVEEDDPVRLLTISGLIKIVMQYT